jgi:hypothetical protein
MLTKTEKELAVQYLSIVLVGVAVGFSYFLESDNHADFKSESGLE